MATNILILPLAEMTATTGTNEDWIDSVQFLQEDGITPIPLTGITFAMEVRAHTDDSEVVITASSDDARLSYGGVSDSYLTISIPVSVMDDVASGTYVADIVATADDHTRVVIRLTEITLFQGVTR